MLQVAKNVNLTIVSEQVPKKDKIQITNKLVKVKKTKRKTFRRFTEEDVVAPREPIFIDESETDLCALIWQSVIMQALYDLTIERKAPEGKFLRSSAVAWFTGSASCTQSDFAMVCDLAGVCKLKVVKIARKVIAEGEKALLGFSLYRLRKDFSDREPTKRAK
jgi:hypothetical protein